CRLHINNPVNLMKQIIKKLDNPNHYDKIVGSLDSLTRKGLRLNSKRDTQYISYWTTVIEHYLKA
ncbi:hypothetical protein, partial [Psychrobacter glaciei]|uniref:hypothetical protein n=1 Tax=Psychrobacter glaciei TaxID=619771 RepID=UPI001D130065